MEPPRRDLYTVVPASVSFACGGEGSYCGHDEKFQVKRSNAGINRQAWRE